MGAALLALLGVALTALGSYYSATKTNEANMEINKSNQEWQEKMQDKENEYSSPENQVARLKSAGINPIAGIMSNGLSVSGNTSAAHGNPTIFPMADPMAAIAGNSNLFGSAFDSFNSGLDSMTFRQARLKQIEEQCNQIRSDAKRLNASADAQLIANKYADERELWALAGQKSKVRLDYSQVAINNRTLRKLSEEINNLILEGQETKSRIDINVLSLDEVLAHIAEMESVTDLNKAKTVTEGHMPDVLDAEAAKNLEERGLTAQESSKYVELTDKIISHYDQAIKKMCAETGLTEQEAYWYLFDKADDRSLQIFGNRFARTRFGERRYRKAYDKAFDKALEDR